MCERPRTTFSVAALYPGLDPVLTRSGICIPPAVIYLPYRLSGLTLRAVGRSRLLARWHGIVSWILCGILDPTSSTDCFKRLLTCSRDSLLVRPTHYGVLNGNALHKLPTLKYRRYRGDMIELFKIIKGICDPACVPHLEFMELTDNLIKTTRQEVINLNLFSITVIMT